MARSLGWSLNRIGPVKKSATWHPIWPIPMSYWHAVRHSYPHVCSQIHGFLVTIPYVRSFTSHFPHFRPINVALPHGPCVNMPAPVFWRLPAGNSANCAPSQGLGTKEYYQPDAYGRTIQTCICSIWYLWIVYIYMVLIWIYIYGINMHIYI